MFEGRAASAQGSASQAAASGASNVAQSEPGSAAQATTTAPSPTFDHVARTCRDPLAVERFYTRYFGFRRARVAPIGGGRQIVFIRNGGMYLELFTADEPSPTPAGQGDGPQHPGVRHIAFKVDDLDATLSRMGYEVRRRITRGPLDFSAFIPGWRTYGSLIRKGKLLKLARFRRRGQSAANARLSER